MFIGFGEQDELLVIPPRRLKVANTFNLVMKDLMKKTVNDILNRFMRGRNLMNVNIATKDLIKKKTSKGIFNQFMMEEILGMLHSWEMI